MNLKTKIAAAVVSLGVLLGVGAGVSSASFGPAFGITYDSKDPVHWGATQVQGAASFSGQAYGDMWGQTQIMRYTGSGWVGQNAITEYRLFNGTYYGGTVTFYSSCQPGYFTYRVRTRLVTYPTKSYQTPWDYSAGKNMAC